jgi:hypothetical protein
LTCYRGYSLSNGQCYKVLIVQQATSGLQQASSTNSNQGSSSQQTTVTRQGSADLQFGIVTVPIDNGTVVTNTITGVAPTIANITGSSSGQVTSGVSTTTTRTTTGTTTTGTSGGVSSFPGSGSGSTILPSQSYGVLPVSGGIVPSYSQTNTTTSTNTLPLSTNNSGQISSPGYVQGSSFDSSSSNNYSGSSQQGTATSGSSSSTSSGYSQGCKTYDSTNTCT